MASSLLTRLSGHVFWEIVRRLSPQDQLRLRAALPPGSERLRRLCVAGRRMAGRTGGRRIVAGSVAVVWSDMGEVALVDEAAGGELRDWRTWRHGKVTSVATHRLEKSAVVFVAGRRAVECFRVASGGTQLRSVGVWPLPRGVTLLPGACGCGTEGGVWLAMAVPVTCRGMRMLLCLVTNTDDGHCRTELRPWPANLANVFPQGRDDHLVLPTIDRAEPFMLWPSVESSPAGDGTFVVWDRDCDHVVVFWRAQHRAVYWLEHKVLAATGSGIVITEASVVTLSAGCDAVTVALPITAQSVVLIVGMEWILYIAAKSSALCLLHLPDMQLFELPLVSVGNDVQALFFEGAQTLLIRMHDCSHLVSLSSLKTVDLGVRTRLVHGKTGVLQGRDTALVQGDTAWLWFGVVKRAVRWCTIDDMVTPTSIPADGNASSQFFLMQRGKSRLCHPTFLRSTTVEAQAEPSEPELVATSPFAARLAQLEASARRLARALSALSSGIDEDSSELKDALTWDMVWVPPEVVASCDLHGVAPIDEHWYVMFPTKLRQCTGDLQIVSHYEGKSVRIPGTNPRWKNLAVQAFVSADKQLVLWCGTKVTIVEMEHVRKCFEEGATQLRHYRQLVVPGGTRRVSMVRPHFVVMTMQNRVAVLDLNSIEPPKTVDLSKY